MSGLTLPDTIMATTQNQPFDLPAIGLRFLAGKSLNYPIKCIFSDGFRQPTPEYRKKFRVRFEPHQV